VIRLKTTVVICIGMVAPVDGLAWCDFEGYPNLDGTNSSCSRSSAGTDGDCDQPLPFVNTLLFTIEDDCPGWDSFLGGAALDCINPNADLYYKSVIGHLMDSSLQAWSRDGRSAIKVGITGFAASAVPANDGINTISVSNSCAGSTGNTDVESDDVHVDIIFKGGCGGGSTNIATVSFADGGGSGAYRIVRHEVGHALGLAHQCVSSGTASNCPGRNPENVCFDGPLLSSTGGGSTWQTDYPHGEDVEGIQELHRGDTLGAVHRSGPYVTPSSLLPRREVVLTQATLSTATPPALTETSTSPTGLFSVFPARIDCRRGNGSGGADCVIVRAWTERNLRFNTLSVASPGGTPIVGTTLTTNGVRTRRPPDVAVSHGVNPIENVAIAVVAHQEPSDSETCSTAGDCAAGETCTSGACRVPCSSSVPCDADETCTAGLCSTAFNRPRSSVIHRYTNLTGTPSHTSFELDSTGPDDITTSDPRVTYVRSFGGSCLQGACSGGWLLSSGRFLVMQLKLDRTPVLYLSNVGGTSFNKMTEDTNGSVPRLSDRMIHEGFDIACPNHANTEGTSADRECRIVFDSYRRDGSLNTDFTPSGEQISCTILLGTTFTDVLRFRNLGCTDGSSFGANRSYTVSLTDYGYATPISQRQTRSWLLTQAAPSPGEGSSITNSRFHTWNHSGTTLTSSAYAGGSSYRFDKITCVTMNGEKPMSYFGGTSIDYAEDAQRLYRLDWGIQGAADVPDSLCY
jgi:hypothetical protein